MLNHYQQIKDLSRQGSLGNIVHEQVSMMRATSQDNNTASLYAKG